MQHCVFHFNSKRAGLVGLCLVWTEVHQSTQTHPLPPATVCPVCGETPTMAQHPPHLCTASWSPHSRRLVPPERLSCCRTWKQPCTRRRSQVCVTFYSTHYSSAASCNDPKRCGTYARIPHPEAPPFLFASINMHTQQDNKRKTGLRQNRLVRGGSCVSAAAERHNVIPLWIQDKGNYFCPAGPDYCVQPQRNRGGGGRGAQNTDHIGSAEAQYSNLCVFQSVLIEDEKNTHHGLAPGTGFSTRLIWCVNLFQKKDPIHPRFVTGTRTVPGSWGEGPFLGGGVEIAANRKCAILAFGMFNRLKVFALAGWRLPPSHSSDSSWIQITFGLKGIEIGTIQAFFSSVSVGGTALQELTFLWD